MYSISSQESVIIHSIDGVSKYSVVYLLSYEHFIMVYIHTSKVGFWQAAKVR